MIEGIQNILLWVQQLLHSTLFYLQQLLGKYEILVAWCILIFMSMFLGGVVYHGIAMTYRRWLTARRFKRGLLAEKQAAKLLRRYGYKILAAQLKETIIVYVNGEPQKSTVRADFLVRKGWKTYIVEVKSGQQGTIKQVATRRQLLEYKLVYEPDGIILLDMEHHNLQKISFAYTKQHRNIWWRYGVFSIFSGALIYGILHIF